MELLWIFLLLFKVCLANTHKEGCSRECVVFNIPHILCAPDISKVSVSPYYEYPVPQFRNILPKDTSRTLHHLIPQGECCTTAKQTSCEEIPKPVEPKTVNPELTPQVKNVPGGPPLISVREDLTPRSSSDKPASPAPKKTSSPVEILAIDLDISQGYPVFKPPAKHNPPCKESHKPCPPHEKPPDSRTCPLPECHLPILPNAPTSSFIFPGSSFECYPEPYVNPRYLFELCSLYDQPHKCKQDIPPNLTTQNTLGRVLPTADSRGMKQGNPNMCSILFDLDFPSDCSDQCHFAIKPDTNKYSNIPIGEPQNCKNKDHKNQCSIPDDTEKFPIPPYVDTNYMHNIFQAYPRQPRPQPPTLPHHQPHRQNHSQLYHQHHSQHHLHHHPQFPTQPHPQPHQPQLLPPHPQLSPQHHPKHHPQPNHQPHPQHHSQPYPGPQPNPHPQPHPQPHHYPHPQHHPQLPPQPHQQLHPQPHPQLPPQPHPQLPPQPHPQLPPQPHPQLPPQPHHQIPPQPHLQLSPQPPPQHQPQPPNPHPPSQPHHQLPHQPHAPPQPHPHLQPQSHPQPHPHPQPTPTACDNDEECPDNTTPEQSEPQPTQNFDVNFMDFVLEHYPPSENNDEKDTHEIIQTEGENVGITIHEVPEINVEGSEIKKDQT